jgi:segregation and condensation protein B
MSDENHQEELAEVSQKEHEVFEDPVNDVVSSTASSDRVETLSEENGPSTDEIELIEEIEAEIGEETVLGEAAALISPEAAGQTEDEITAMREELEPANDGVNEEVSSTAAEDRAETLSEEEGLIVGEIELGEVIEAEIGEETVLGEAAALISPEAAGQIEDEITAMREEFEPANDGVNNDGVNEEVSSTAAEDRAETLSEEEGLIVDEIELGEEIEAEIGEEIVLGEAAALISPEAAGQIEDEITAMREEFEPANDGVNNDGVNEEVSSTAAEDRAETLSEEEGLIADEIELGEEIEAEIGEEIVLGEAAALISPEAAGQIEDEITATREEIKPAIEALLFVAEEPLPFKILCKLLGDVSEEDVRAALDELGADYEARKSGLEIREIAGGWRISTRPQNHDFIRKYLKSRPSARLSLPALETLAVIAYKQPITIPEILEIRGVTSSSAIKTLLEKRLIVTKGRKETVGRPMLYGTSKEFLIQFGLKDLTELPSIEDFEDLAQ